MHHNKGGTCFFGGSISGCFAGPPTGRANLLCLCSTIVIYTRQSIALPCQIHIMKNCYIKKKICLSGMRRGKAFSLVRVARQGGHQDLNAMLRPSSWFCVRAYATAAACPYSADAAASLLSSLLRSNQDVSRGDARPLAGWPVPQGRLLS